MAQSQVWKTWERQVATDLGGKRTGPMGVGLPDVILPDLAPECKARIRLSLLNSDLEQAETNRINSGRRWWAVFLRENKTARKVVVVPYDYFVELYNNQRSSDG